MSSGDVRAGGVGLDAHSRFVRSLVRSVARFHVQTFVEKSRFLKEDGKWLYVDGEQDWEPTLSAPRPGFGGPM